MIPPAGGTANANQPVLRRTITLVAQVCAAHRADGGRVVVVMSQREKLDMEALYRRQVRRRIRRGIHCGAQTFAVNPLPAHACQRETTC